LRKSAKRLPIIKTTNPAKDNSKGVPALVSDAPEIATPED
jgi:hypothetical protein